MVINKQDIIINNADILLSGVAHSGIYLNNDSNTAYYNNDSFKQNILQKLNAHPRNSCFTNKGYWAKEVTYSKEIFDLIKSHSSYAPLNKREYVSLFIIDKIMITDFLDNNALSTSLVTSWNALSTVTRKYVHALEDIEIRFYEFGNATISGRLKLRNCKIAIDEYCKISEFIHTFFRDSLLQEATTCVTIFQDVMQDLYRSKALQLQSFEVLGTSANQNKPGELSLLTFSIRYHFIHDSNLKQLDNFTEIMSDILLGEWELNFKNSVTLATARVYYGWTHSLILLDDLDNHSSNKFYTMYKFPLDAVLANWGALNAISKKIELARSLYIVEIDNLKIKSNKNYSAISNDIRSFSLKVERVIQSLDSYTYTNNPMLYKLIELQQDAFLEHKSVARIKNQLALVSQLVSELSIREKDNNDKKMNYVLSIITFLTLLGGCVTLYDIVFSGKYNIVQMTEIVIAFVIIFLVLYLFDLKNGLSNKRSKKSSRK